MRNQKAINKKISQSHLKRVTDGIARPKPTNFKFSGPHTDVTKQKMKQNSLEKWHDKILLIEKDCLVSNNALKRYLLETFKCCEICAISKWNGKYIALHIHHKDGNKYNDKLSNVQLLCPNCHSQTNNFGYKKRLELV